MVMKNYQEIIIKKKNKQKMKTVRVTMTTSMRSTMEILKWEPIYNLYILETHFLDPHLVQQNNKKKESPDQPISLQYSKQV